MPLDTTAHPGKTVLQVILGVLAQPGLRDLVGRSALSVPLVTLEKMVLQVCIHIKNNACQAH